MNSPRCHHMWSDLRHVKQKRCVGGQYLYKLANNRHSSGKFTGCLQQPRALAEPEHETSDNERAAQPARTSHRSRRGTGPPAPPASPGPRHPRLLPAASRGDFAPGNAPGVLFLRCLPAPPVARAGASPPPLRAGGK